jgi:multidrug efflux system membrane fusion protein
MKNDASAGKWLGRRLGYRLGAAVLVTAGLAVEGCRKQEAAAPPERPAPLVTATDVMTRDVPLYLDEIGKCVSPLVVNIRPQVEGRITQVHVQDGAELKKGDLMFVNDPRPYQADLAQAKATLAKNQADLELSKVEFENTQKLRGTQAISTEEYDQKRLAVSVNEAQVKAGEAAVETAQLNLEYCTIKSPIDGRGGARLVDIGNVVKANEGTLMIVQSLDPIYADFTIPENKLPEVRHYMSEGTLAVEAQLPADGGQGLAATTQALATQPAGTPNAAPATQPAPAALAALPADRMGHWEDARVGKLTFLDNAVQDGTGTIKLRATIPNADHHFWPGQFVNVRLVLTVKKNAVLVPQQAMQIGQQGSYVYVVKADNTAEMRQVHTGQTQGNLVVVDEGLKVGERVIVTGQLTVMPGAKVRLTSEAAGQSAAAGAVASTGGSKS